MMKYLVILGIAALCVLIAPAMGDIAACSQCTPDTQPAMGTVCPAACILAFDSDYWAVTSEAALAEASSLPTGASKFSGNVIKWPSIDPMVSKWSGRNVESDLKAQFIALA